MTEYELADNAMSYLSTALTAFGMYITVISGYVITAFVAGKRLNLSQVWIVNVLFFFTASAFTMVTVGCYVRTNEYANRLLELDPNRASYFSEFAAVLVGVIQILGIVASLYFMWSKRRIKEE